MSTASTATRRPPAEGTDNYWIREAGKTWKEEDGKQKIHYSQPAPGKRPGAHTDTIVLDTFLAFYEKLEDKQIDIMLEVKDKNLSAVKCVNATLPEKRLSLLEKEWGRYKYTILEKAAADYQSIRTLLKDKSAYPVTEFYRLIEDALATVKRQLLKLAEKYEEVYLLQSLYFYLD
ncbi:uv-endonuclease uvde [Trichococcus palustris]|uniref:Uv-endonuclease uvde n=1 Tax=Trichococcus palustris TaxID=140314 RepID=A0A143YSE8_9LACT|nr:uv-endonuclease uvde [Trichococcus palustris]SFK73591.1 UV-endonuclease UvdE [Trichococcus palustris]